MKIKIILLCIILLVSIFSINSFKEGLENSKNVKKCDLPIFDKGIVGKGSKKCVEGGVLAPGKICDIGCEDKYQYESGRNILSCDETGILSKNNLKCRLKTKPQKIPREDITIVCEPNYAELIELLKNNGIIQHSKRDYSKIVDCVKSNKKKTDKSTKKDKNMKKQPNYYHNMKKFPGNTGADSKPYNSLMNLL